MSIFFFLQKTMKTQIHFNLNLSTSGSRSFPFGTQYYFIIIVLQHTRSMSYVDSSFHGSSPMMWWFYPVASIKQSFLHFIDT